MEHVDQDSLSWVWWATLVVVGVVNHFLYFRAVANQTPAESKDARDYQWWMKMLAFPYVFVCAYRSVFPTVYEARIAFFDTAFNNIMLERTMACIAELAWAAQIAMATQFVNKDLAYCGQGFLEKPIKLVCYLVVALAAIAECCSYTCVFTTCNIFCVAENSLWTTMLALLSPCCFVLFLRCRWAKKVDTRAASFFVGAMFVGCACFVLYMVTFNLPMYVDRYHQDNAAGKKLFGFVDGAWDTLLRWEVNRGWAIWQDEWVWLSGYFTGGVWLAIALLSCPRIVGARTQPTSKKQTSKKQQ